MKNVRLLAAISLKGAISTTIVVMSGMASYYLSQLPFEATIVYAHGMLWWAILLAIYVAATGMTDRWLR